MTLSFHRQELWHCLSHLSEYEWAEVKPLMKGWWDAYKKWERTDTFEAAFREGHMIPS